MTSGEGAAAPPAVAAGTVHFEVPREALVRLFWRRMSLRPKRIASTAILLVAGTALVALARDGATMLLGAGCFAVALAGSIGLYRALGRAVDANPQFSQPKTLAFDTDRLVVTGPDWRSEIPWSRFTSLSEDGRYFYLELGATGIASVVPKAAFDAAQLAAFRSAAQAIARVRA